MRMRIMRYAAALLALVVVAEGAGRAEAGVITEFTAGQSAASISFIGQSLTTAAGGPFNNITFSFFSDIDGGTTPVAAGDLFILMQEYLGTPDDLSGSTPGFLAQSTGIAGGVFLFDGAVTLLGGAQYFVYTNASILVSGSNLDAYPGGNAYITGRGTSNYSFFAGDANFRLTGDAVAAVPEPSSFISAGIAGVLTLGHGWRRRRHAKASAA